MKSVWKLFMRLGTGLIIVCMSSLVSIVTGDLCSVDRCEFSCECRGNRDGFLKNGLISVLALMC